MSQIPIITIMDYRQYRKMRRLVLSCGNYDSGNCLVLDDGEECVCVQSISYSLLCRWFRVAVCVYISMKKIIHFRMIDNEVLLTRQAPRAKQTGVYYALLKSIKIPQNTPL